MIRSLLDHQINGYSRRVSKPMAFYIKRMTLFLVVVSALAIFPCVDGGCGGSCSVSGGSSYNFMSDSAFNIGMSTFDEFVRDNGAQTSLSTKSLSTDDPASANSSLNQTSNATKTDVEVLPCINSSGNTSSDIEIVKLGTSGAQDTRVSTLVLTTFNSKF